jgi:hypothetical protein
MASPNAVAAARANMVETMQIETARPTAPVPVVSSAAKKCGSEPSQRAPLVYRNSAKRVRVSLRLDTDRHLRLKLVATHLNRTLQSVFVQAVDEFFERHAPNVLDGIVLVQTGDGVDTRRNKSRRKAKDDQITENPLGPTRSR